jgi:hypothetical protein
MNNLFKSSDFRLEGEYLIRNVLLDRRSFDEVIGGFVVVAGDVVVGPALSAAEPGQSLLQCVDALLHLEVFVYQFRPEKKYFYLIENEFGQKFN